MRHNVARAVSARPGASLALLLVLLAGLLTGSARAGDRALLDVIGYSADGQYFAFEEYGVQDGSGLAYSSIYVIDLVADKWTYGTPFDARAAEDKPDTPLAEIRAAARAKASDKISAHHVEVPAEVLALIGDGAVDTDGRTLSFATPMCCGAGQVQDDRTSLALTTLPSAAGVDYCADMETVGYALAITDAAGTRELHRDGRKLPFSRGCTLDYRLHSVVAPFEGRGPRVAIIASYPYGFEGPDRRFLATAIDRP